KSLFESAGLQVAELRKFHELSIPYEFYMKKLIKRQRVVNFLLPVVRLFFSIFKIQNKQLVIGKKPGA
ncbi:MAG TPA: hypothetical protein VHO49_00480, partial [Anaerolineales bacterium]|nr:hypothetical protein [Anaerolineales bacterium]